MADDFNTSNREILNTATGERESSQLDQSTGGVSPEPAITPTDINAPQAPTPFPESTPAFDQELTPGGAEFQDFSGVDTQVQRSIDPVTQGAQQNINSLVQSNWDKLGNAVASGMSKGAVAAVEPLLSVVGAGIGLLDEDYEKAINRFDDNLKNTISENFEIHESIMNPGDSLLDTWDNFARFSTLESITESATQFGLLGAGAGAVTRTMGSLLLNAGGAYSKVVGAGKVANMLQQTLGTGYGRYMANPVPIFGVKSNAIAQGLLSNYLEGRVMADEIEHQMKSQYANTLNDPTVSKEVKANIMDGIADAQTDMQALNSLLAVNDIIGFSRLGSIINGKGLGFKGLKKFTKDGVPLFSVTEGMEENLQNQISGIAMQNAQVGIEQKYAEGNEKIPGVEGISLDDVIDSDKPAFRPENTLLWANDPEAANQIAVDNARTLGNFLIEHATSKQALVETMSGMVGGGPQWLITGAPRKILNGRKEAKRVEAQDNLTQSAEKQFQALAVEDLRNETNLTDVLDQIKHTIPLGSDDQYIRDIAETYITENTVFTSIANGNADSLGEYFEEQEEMNTQALNSGEITQEEYDIANKRLQYGKELLKENEVYGTYANSGEILQDMLMVKAHDAAILAAESALARQVELEEKVETATPEELAGEALAAETQVEKEETSPIVDEETPNAQTSKTPSETDNPENTEEETGEENPSASTGDPDLQAQYDRKVQNLKDLNEFLESFPEDNLSPKEKERKKNAEKAIKQTEAELGQLQSKLAAENPNNGTRSNKNAAKAASLRNRRLGALEEWQETRDNILEINETEKTEKLSDSTKELRDKFIEFGEELLAEVEETDQELDNMRVPKDVVGDENFQTPEEFKDLSAKEIFALLKTEKTGEQETPKKKKPKKKKITQEEAKKAEKEFKEKKPEPTVEEAEEATLQNITEADISSMQINRARYQAHINYVLSPEGQIKAIQNQKVRAKYDRRADKIKNSKNISYVSGQVSKLQNDLNKSNNTYEQTLLENTLRDAKKKLAVLRSEAASTKKKADQKVKEKAKAENTEAEVEDEFEDEDGHIFDEEGDENEDEAPHEAEEVDETEDEGEPELQVRQQKELADQVANTVFRSKAAAQEMGDAINNEAEKFNQTKEGVPPTNLDSEYTEEGQTARAQSQQVFRFVSNVLNSFAEIAPGAPVSFESVLAVVEQIPNVDIQQAEPVLRFAHAAWSGEPYSETHSTIKKEQPKQKDTKHLEPDPKDLIPAEDITTASFSIQGAAIAYDGDVATDFHLVKEGTPLEFRVVTDEDEIRSNPAYNTVYVNDGKTIIPYSWDNFKAKKAAVDKNGGIDPETGQPSPLASPDYDFKNIVPIEVLIGEGATGEGEKIGHIHTAQWVTKYRVDRTSGEPKTMDPEIVRGVLDATTTMREKIIAGETTGSVDGRLSNIQQTEGYFKGTSISFNKSFVNEDGKTISAYRRTGSILGDARSEIKYAVIGEDGEIQQNILEAEKAANPNVKFIYPSNPKNRLLDEVATPGSVVALVPLENSDLKAVVKLVTKKVDPQVFDYIGHRLKRLVNDSTNTFSPTNIKNTIESIMAVQHKEGQATDTFKVSITKGKGSFVFNGYHNNRKWTLNYEVDSKKINDHKYKHGFKLTSAQFIDLNNGDNDRLYEGTRVKGGMAEFLQFMAEINSDEESRPIANIESIKLFESQYNEKSTQSSVIVKNNRATPSKVEYIETILEDRTTTNLKPPISISNDEFNFTTNTIITVSHNEPGQAKVQKKVAQEKVDKEQVVVAAPTEIELIENDIALFEELNEHAKAANRFGKKKKDTWFLELLETSVSDEDKPFIHQDAVDGLLAVYEDNKANYDTLTAFVRDVADQNLKEAKADLKKLKAGTRKAKGKAKISLRGLSKAPSLRGLSKPRVSTSTDRDQEEEVADTSTVNRNKLYELFDGQGYIKEVDGVLMYKGLPYASEGLLKLKLFKDIALGANLYNKGPKEMTVDEVREYISSKSFRRGVENMEKFHEKNREIQSTDNIIERNIGAAEEAINQPIKKEDKVELAATPADLQVARLSLAKYAYKVIRPNPYSGEIPVAKLNSAEEDAVSHSVKGLIMKGFRETGKEELTREDFKGLIVGAKIMLEANMNKTIKDLNRLIESGSLNEEDTRKAMQKMEAMSFLLSDSQYSVRKMEKIVRVGQALALDELGYTKNTEMSTSDVAIGDVETFADNFSIMKDPREGMTARLKAKIATYHTYTVTDDGVVPDVDIVGSPMIRTHMFEKLVEVFDGRVTNNYSEKVEILNDEIKKIKANRVRYADIAFLEDLKADLESKKDSTNPFTKQDVRSFNRALNKDMNNARGLDVSKRKIDKKLVENDPNFNTRFVKIMNTLSEKMEMLVAAGAGETISNLIQRGSNYKFVVKGKSSIVKATPDIKSWTEDLEFVRTQAEGAKLIELNKGITFLTYINEEWLSMPDHRQAEFESVFGKPLYVVNENGGRTLTETGKKAIDGAQRAKRVMAEEVSNRLGVLLKQTGVDIRSDSVSIITEALMANEMVDLTTYTGEKVGTQNELSNAITQFVEDTIEQIQNPKKVAKQGFRSFINWITSQVTSAIQSATVRIKDKVFGVINDPIALNQNVRELNGDRSKMNRDIMASKSRILAIKDGKVKSEATWLKNVLSKTYRAIQPTWLSDLNKADSPFLHSLYNFGTYLESIDFSRKEDGVETPGTKYDVMSDTIGDVAYNELKIRSAKFQAPTFSDKDSPFSVDGIDFDAVEVTADGEVRIKDKYLRYWIDSVVVPELNRAAKHIDSDNKIDGYKPGLIYSLPGLNKDGRVMDLVRELNLGGDELLTLYSDEHTSVDQTQEHADAITELRELVKNAATNELISGTENYLDLLVENGLMERTDAGDFKLDKQLSNIKTFKNLNIKAKVASNNAKADLESVRKKAAITISSAFDDVITILDGDKIEWGGAEDLLFAFEDFIKDDQLEKLGNLAADIDDNYSGYAAIDRLAKEMGMKINEKTARAILSHGGQINGVNLSTEEKNKALNTTAKVLENAYLGDSEYFTDDFKEAIVLSKTNLANAKASKASGGGVVLSESGLKQVVMNRQFGYSFSQANMSQLLFGDVAFFYKQSAANKHDGAPEWGQEGYDYVEDIYATYDNLGKRLAKEVSPGVFSEGVSKALYIAIKEPKRGSLFYNKESKDYIDVGQMDIADAASYVTVNSRLQFLIQEGAITEEQAPWVKKYWNGKDGKKQFTAADLDAKFPGLSKKAHAATNKPRHVEFEMIEMPDGTFVRSPFYGKVAETVLTDSLIAGNPKTNELARIKAIMEQVEAEENKGEVWDNVDEWTAVRLSPPSGIKTGGRKNQVDILGDNAIMPDKKGKFVIPEESKVRLTMQGYARQVRTDYKEGKKVKSSGQVENLIWNAIGTKTKLRQRWNTALERGYKYGFDVLDSMFSVDADDTAIAKIVGTDMVDVTAFDKTRQIISDAKISKIIKSSLLIQKNIDASEMNPNMLKWLELDDNGNFRKDIADSMYFQDFMDILRVTFEKKTVQAKRAGSQLPLKSGLGYDFNKTGYGDNQIYLFDNAKIDKSGRLRPQAHGKPAQILVPFDFKWIDKNGKDQPMDLKDFLVVDKSGRTMIDSSKLPKEVFEQMGYRTPTQDYSMMSYVEVVGFFPPAYLNSVVAPDEFTKLMGSDFDIDKLFTYKYTFTQDEDGSFRTINYNDAEEHPHLEKLAIDNEKLSILNEVLNDPKIVKEEIVQQLNGEDEFRDFADELYDMTRTGNHDRQSYLNGSFQETKRNNAAGGKQAIGVWASLSRFSAQIRDRKIPFFAKDAQSGKMKPTKIQLGPSNKAVVKHMASGRLTIFKNNPEEVETVFNKLKNNISAFISIAVDNEKLQMIHKLGMNQRSYNKISALLLGGFRGKTALAMTNQLIHDADKNVNKVRADFIKAYNSKPGNVKKIAGPGGKGVVITSKDFTLLQEGMTEEKFTKQLMDLNKRVRDAYASDSLHELDNNDLTNSLALYDFVNKMSSSLENTYKPFQWVVNQDSQGFERNIKNMYTNMHNISDNSDYSEVWKEYKKVPEMVLAAEAAGKYHTVLAKLNTPGGAMSQVMNVLKESDIELRGTYHLTTYLNNSKYRSITPNIQSITSRIATIRASMHPDAIAFRENNVFFNNMVVTPKSISFRKNESMTPKLIIDSLEDIARYGEIAGIDMNLLHNDIIAYGMTAMGNTLGDSILPYISPDYYTKDTTNTLDDPFKAAAYAAYQNIDDIRASDSKSTSPIRKVRKGDEYVIEYLNPETGEYRIMDSDSIKKIYSLSTGERTESLMNDEIGLESRSLGDDPRKGDIEPINISNVLERVLSFPDMVPFKKMMNSLLPSYLKGVKSQESNEWRPDKVELVLAKPTYYRDLKANLVHEGTHAVLQGALSAYEKGSESLRKFLRGKNPDNKVISTEFERVANRLDDTRKEAAFEILKSGRGHLDALIKGDSLDDYTDYSLVGYGIMSNLFLTEYNQGNDLIEFVDDTDIEMLFGADSNYREVLDSYNKGTFKGTTQQLQMLKMYGGMKAMKANRLSVRNISGIDFLVLTMPNGREIAGEKIDEFAFENMKDYLLDIDKTFIKNKYTTKYLMSVLADVGNTSAEDAEFTSQEVDWYQKLMYGTQNIHEFTSMAMSHAVSGKDTFTKKDFLGYQDFVGYKSAIKEKLPKGVYGKLQRAVELLKSLINTILGERHGNEIWKDVVYLKALNNFSTFVVEETSTNQGVNTQSYSYTDIAEDILKTCIK
jgi:hypothetical protein